MAATQSHIKTTVVGSYPIPDWLAAKPSEQALIDATRVVFSTQETAGIDLVCDGELYRFDVNHPETNGMIDYFARPLSGLRSELTFDEILAFRAGQGMAGQGMAGQGMAGQGMGWRKKPTGIIEGPLGCGTLNLGDACARARSLTTRPLKFTLTGPHMIAKTLVDNHYRDIAEVTHAIADILAEQVRHLDADVVQVDEANLPGHADEWEWAASAINRVLDAVQTTAAVHLCFGNYGGQEIQTGSWDKLLNYLNSLHVDHIVMENAHRPAEELVVFKDLRPEIGMGLGVLDIKSTVVESADDIARAIERAESIVGAGRIRYIHPDCGLWNLKRYIADGKIGVLKEGRDLYEGRRSTTAA